MNKESKLGWIIQTMVIFFLIRDHENILKSEILRSQLYLFLPLSDNILSECIKDARNQSSVEISNFVADKQLKEEKEFKYLTRLL